MFACGVASASQLATQTREVADSQRGPEAAWAFPGDGS